MNGDEKPETDDATPAAEGELLLPTLAGAAKAVENTGVLKSLLGPVAKVVGDHWGKSAQQWIDAKEAKRASNIRGHQLRVIEVEPASPNQGEPSERQVASLIQWAEHAQTIDPETESELAALWQALLGKIYRNDPDTDEMIEVVKQLSRIDALLILEMPEHGIRNSRLDEWRVKKMLSLGVLHKYSFARMGEFAVITASVSSAGGLIAFISYTFFRDSIPRASPETVGSLVFLIVCLFSASVGLIVHAFSYLRFTRLGRNLRKSGARYWTSPKKPA